MALSLNSVSFAYAQGTSFEQRALDFRRRAVDLVGKDKVGEDGAPPHGKLAVLLVIDHRADNVCGEKIGCELDAMKFRLNCGRERFNGKRFREAGDAFQEHVTVGEEPDEEPFDHILLADDDLAHLANGDPVAATKMFLHGVDDSRLHTLLRRPAVLIPAMPRGRIIATSSTLAVQLRKMS